MIRFLKEVYLTAFTLLYRLRPSQKDSTRVGRALAGITLIEWFVLVGISSCIEMFAGAKNLFYFSKVVIVIAIFALYFVNQYVLATRGHGIRFEREFDKLKKTKRTLLMGSCAVLLVTAMAFFIYAGLAHRRFIGAD
jgi:hypothetical protein